MATPVHDARVSLLTPPTIIELQGPPDDVLPRLRSLGLEDPPAQRCARSGALEVLRPAPQHWWLLAPAQDGPALLAGLFTSPPGPDTLIVEVSDGWAHFLLEGTDAGDLLASASPLDTHPRAFAADGAAFTEAFGLRALVLRRPGGFQLAVERSHGPMVADWFARLQGLPRSGPLVAGANFC